MSRNKFEVGSKVLLKETVRLMNGINYYYAPKGTEVKIIDYDNGVYKITDTKHFGYVSEDYLEKAPSSITDRIKTFEDAIERNKL